MTNRGEAMKESSDNHSKEGEVISIEAIDDEDEEINKCNCVGTPAMLRLEELLMRVID